MALVYVLTTSSHIKRKRLVGPPRQASQPPLGEKRTNDLITVRLGGNLLSLFKKKKKKGVAAAAGPEARTRAAWRAVGTTRIARSLELPQYLNYSCRSSIRGDGGKASFTCKRIWEESLSPCIVSRLGVLPSSIPFAPRRSWPRTRRLFHTWVAVGCAPGSALTPPSLPPLQRWPWKVTRAWLGGSQDRRAQGHEKRAQTSAIRSHALEAQIEL